MEMPPRPAAPQRSRRRRRPLWATLLLAGAAAVASLPRVALAQYGSNNYNARMGGGRAFARGKAMATDGFGATYILGKAAAPHSNQGVV